jgi:hypothetical protein
VDGLTFEEVYGPGVSNGTLINVFDVAAVEKVVHFRNVKLERVGESKRELLCVTPVVSTPPKSPMDVGAIYLHDHYGLGRHAKAVWIHSKLFADDGLKYHEEKPLTGSHYDMATVVAEVKDVEFPKLLDPVDDLPPTTVITHVRKLADGKLAVRGTTADNGAVKCVLVNGKEAKAVTPNFTEWEIILDNSPRGAVKLQASAEDAAGNVEKRGHVVVR